MMKSERGSAGRTFLLVVAVLALFAVVVYLLSERNARTYTLVLEDGYLAVKKGVVAPGTLTQIRDGLTQAHKSAEGKMLMMLWNLKGFAEVPKDYDDQLDKIAKAYPPPAKIGPTVATKVEK